VIVQPKETRNGKLRRLCDVFELKLTCSSYNCGGTFLHTYELCDVSSKLTPFQVRVMSLANALKLPSQSPAIDAGKKAMFLETAPTKSLAAVVAAVGALEEGADTQAGVAKNVTNAASSVTSLVTAPLKAVAVATAVDMVVATVEAEAVPAVVKLATPAVDSVTCPATVPRARSATTVSHSTETFVHNADKSLRRRSRPPFSRLSSRTIQRARLLQVQAAWPRSGILPELKLLLDC
jgi:hypothetical protein